MKRRWFGSLLTLTSGALLVSGVLVALNSPSVTDSQVAVLRGQSLDSLIASNQLFHRPYDPADYQTSAVKSAYFAEFIKGGLHNFTEIDTLVEAECESNPVDTFAGASALGITGKLSQPVMAACRNLALKLLISADSTNDQFVVGVGKVMGAIRSGTLQTSQESIREIRARLEGLKGPFTSPYMIWQLKAACALVSANCENALAKSLLELNPENPLAKVEGVMDILGLLKLDSMGVILLTERQKKDISSELDYLAGASWVINDPFNLIFYLAARSEARLPNIPSLVRPYLRQTDSETGLLKFPTELQGTLESTYQASRLVSYDEFRRSCVRTVGGFFGALEFESGLSLLERSWVKTLLSRCEVPTSIKSEKREAKLAWSAPITTPEALLTLAKTTEVLWSKPCGCIKLPTNQVQALISLGEGAQLILQAYLPLFDLDKTGASLVARSKVLVEKSLAEANSKPARIVSLALKAAAAQNLPVSAVTAKTLRNWKAARWGCFGFRELFRTEAAEPGCNLELSVTLNESRAHLASLPTGG